MNSPGAMGSTGPHENNGRGVRIRHYLSLALGAAIPFALVLPFLNKPLHVDDPNFLVLARAAAEDLWRPHEVELNWVGVTASAFETLSNPPGIAWYLAPVSHGSEWVLHTWMLPWLFLMLWGCDRLGRSFAERGIEAMLLLGTSPVVVLCSQSLTPDLPLLACAVAGIGGFTSSSKRRWIWALLAGCAALFRYSGLAVVPLLALAGWQLGGIRLALVGGLSLLPSLLLALHSLAAYGKIHLLAMASFQSISNSPLLIANKGVAALAMLGGVGLLPILVFVQGNRKRALLGMYVGVLLGFLLSSLLGQTPRQILATALFTGAGCAAVSVMRWTAPQDRLLIFWLLLGPLHFLGLMFMASRYWILFLPAIGLAVLRLRPSRLLVGSAILVNCLVSVGVSVDDYSFAKAHREAALEVASRYPAGTFSGHWGWQYYLEQAGWRPIEYREEPLGYHGTAIAPAPQPWSAECVESVERLELADTWWGPRVYTESGAANFHSNYVSSTDPDATQPEPTFAPWTFANDPYDIVEVFRPCREKPSPSG